MRSFTQEKLDEIKNKVLNHNSKPIGVFITDTHLKEDNIELVKEVFTKSIQVTRLLELNTLYHGGDVFDSRKSQTQLIQSTFIDILGMFREERVRLVTVVGNHDKTNYSSTNSFLDSFGFSPYTFVDGVSQVFKLVSTYHTEPLTPDINITLTPFLEDELYLQNIKGVKLDRSKKNIHLTHIGFEGSIMNSGIEIKGGVGRSTAALFNLTLVGHYHDYQELYDGSVVYFGSCYQGNYGENNKKGLTILFEDLSLLQISLDTPEYVKYEVEVQHLSEKEILSLRTEKEQSRNHIRVVLKGSDEEVNSFNKQLLLNEGIEVTKKTEKVVKEELEEVEKFEVTGILSTFKNFLEGKGYSEEKVLEGEGYMIKGLNTK